MDIFFIFFFLMVIIMSPLKYGLLKENAVQPEGNQLWFTDLILIL